MSDMIEIHDKINSGEKISEKEYAIRGFRIVQELVKKIPELKFDSEQLIETDNGLLDEVFEAGIELAASLGAYSSDTNKLIKFSEEEIREELKRVPREISIGEGKDSRKLVSIKPEQPGCLNAGGVTCAWSENLTMTITRLIASLPIDQYLGGIMLTFNNRAISDSLIETYYFRRMISMIREGLKIAGRPGLSFNAYGPSKAVVAIACLDPELVRKSDCIPGGYFEPPFFSFRHDDVLQSYVAHEYGSHVLAVAHGEIGGWSGGSSGGIIENVANQIIGWVIMKRDIQLVYHIPICNMEERSGPEATWATTTSIQATARNTHIKTSALCQSAGEPGAVTSFLDKAASIVLKSVSGTTIMQITGRPAKPLRENLGSPLEISFGLDVVRAASSLKRNEANEIAKRIYSMLPAEYYKKPPKGLSFEESYDLQTLKPKENYLKVYKEALAKLGEAGLQI